LEFYRDAEAIMPEFKGSYDKQLSYFQRLEEKIAKLKESDPDTPIEENEDYLAFVENNKPQWSADLISDARSEIIIREAQARSDSKYEKKIHALETRPRIEKATKAFNNQAFSEITSIDSSTMNEISVIMDEKGGGKRGVEAAREQFPDEVDAMMKVYSGYSAVAEAMMTVMEGIIPYDPNNPLHEQAGNKVNEFGQSMLAQDPKHHDRNGKKFVTNAQWNGLTDQQREAHWTFSTQELTDFLSADAAIEAEVIIGDIEANQYKVLERVAKNKGITVEELAGKKFVGRKRTGSQGQNARDEVKNNPAPDSSRSGSGNDGDSSSGKSTGFLMTGELN
jgi:hypothetical protein